MSAWHLFCFTIWNWGGGVLLVWGSVYFLFWGSFYVSRTGMGQCLLYWPVYAKKEKMLLVEGLKLGVINLPFLKRQTSKPWFVSICWGLMLVASAASESVTHRNSVQILSGTNMMALKWIVACMTVPIFWMQRYICILITGPYGSTTKDAESYMLWSGQHVMSWMCPHHIWLLHGV